MKQIQFNNEKYNCPQSWEEVTLEQQIKVSKDAEHFKTETTKSIALISGYMGIDPEEMRKSDVRKIAPMFKHLKFMNEPIPDKPVTQFKFKGVEYHIGQNLIQQEFQDFVSLENIMNDTKGNVMEALPYIIAIMAKRLTDDGYESMDDYDVEARAVEFKQLPISIANGIAVFFYTSANLSMATSQLFSNPQTLIAMKVSEVRDTLKPQAGAGLLTRLLIGLSRSYLKSIGKQWEKHFTSIQAKSSLEN